MSAVYGDEVPETFMEETRRLASIKQSLSDIVSPEAETTVNDSGGKQSYIPVRFDLIDAEALFAQAAVLHEGAVKYGENNWRKIPVEDHLNHLIMHAYAYLSGDRTDEHLSHIMCRATFAQAVAITDAKANDLPICRNCGVPIEWVETDIDNFYAHFHNGHTHCEGLEERAEPKNHVI